MNALRDRLAPDIAAAAWPTTAPERWKYSSLRALERLDLDTDPLLQPVEALQVDGYLPPAAALAQGLPFAAAQRWTADAFAVCAQTAAPLRVAQRLVDGDRLFIDMAAVGGYASGKSQLSVAAGAQAQLLIHERSAARLSNVLLQIDLEAGATLDVLRVHENVAGTHAVESIVVSLQQGAQLQWQQLDLGAGWSHRELHVLFDGDGAAATVHGATLLDGRAHCDQQLLLQHQRPQGRSKTLWKTIANGRSRAVFDGLIAVGASATETDAHLKTAAMLLSEHAEVDAKPELIIDTDAVQCSHGASVGQLDPQALFYLQSRGLPQEQARQLLCFAFVLDVLESIRDEALAEQLRARVQTRLPKEVAHGVSG